MFSTLGQGDLLDIGFGVVGSARRVTALGNNPDVDTTSTPEDIWTGGGVYPWLAVATALEIASLNAADAAAGTGARSVMVNGLDANYAEVTQTVALNGGTVALSTALLRVNSVFIMSAGSGKVNAGDILVRDAGGGTTRAIVPAGYGITRQSQYTVPAGWTLQVVSMIFCFNRVIGGSRFATFTTFVQSSLGFYRMSLELTIGDEPPYRHDGIPGLVLTEKTDFCLRCNFTSNDNADLTAGWLGVMRRN
jgi:hypothetical protein